MAHARSWLSAAMLVGFTYNLASAHREHKVHNIVLYPDKHSWCKTTPIKQVVAYPGCSSVEIDNNVCVGACFSYSIPRTSPSAPGELIKPYCDSCQPSTVNWRHVSLVCEGDEDMQERVQMIENCSCSTCDLGDEGVGSQVLQSSGDGDIFRKPSLLDVPELMDLMMETHNTRRNQNHSESINRTTSSNDPVINERMLQLLKQFAEDEERVVEPNLDRVALKELLRQVEGADHRVNQATLGELVRKVEDTEHILVDFAKLKHILARFAHEEMEKEKAEFLPHHEAHRHHQHNHHHSNHHITLDNHHSNHQHGPDSHLALHGGNDEDHNDMEGEHIPHNGAVKHHDLTEKSDNDEELDPTLDVAPYHLKPAVEGTEISYHENIVLPEDEEKHSKTDE